MNRKFLVGLVLAAAVVHAGEVEPTLPQGWEAFYGGGRDGLPGRCEVGVDVAMSNAGTPNMTAKCAMDVPSHGGLFQTFFPDDIRGQRVRFSAMVKSENIADLGNATGVGGLWIRVEGPNAATPILIDNMRDRGITGTMDWKPVEIVADIPRETMRIHFGFYMQGQGQIWVSNLRFEDVPTSVPVTVQPAPLRDRSVPQNLILR